MIAWKFFFIMFYWEYIVWICFSYVDRVLILNLFVFVWVFDKILGIVYIEN